MHLRPGFSWGGPLDRVIPVSFLNSHSITLPSSPPQGSDLYWMTEALAESLSSIGITNPNPAVGCILVDSNGNEISRGATCGFPGAHAEAIAFQRVKDPSLLDGATAFVTLEPCAHHGNQPPCVEILAKSKIRRVVIARLDPDSRVDGKGVQILRDAGKEVVIGTLSSEVTAWNFPFLVKAQCRLERPVFALKWAQTLDGQLADDAEHSKWITGPTARAYTHWLRQRYDAILVGAATVLSDIPDLSARDCNLPHQSDPLPILFDPRGRCLEANSDWIKQSEKRTFREDRPFVILTTQALLKQMQESWIGQKKNGLILALPGKNLVEETAIALKSQEIRNLLGHPLQSVLIEGGAETLSLFLKAESADVLHVFIAPILTGGSAHRIQLQRTLAEAQRFDLVSSSQLGPDFLLEMVSKDAFQVFQAKSHTL